MTSLRQVLLMGLWLSLALLPKAGQAQIAIGTKILEKPYKYNLPTDQDDLLPTDNIVPAFAWRVFSDQEDNATYTSPGGSQVHSRLPFLGQYWVIGEDGEYLRLAEDDRNEGVQLSRFAEDRGWIHKKNLLLWSRAMVTKVGRIDRKAMILNTIDHIKNIKGEPQVVRFRAAPRDDGKLTGHESLLFQFFFVYKETRDYILLGKDIQLPIGKDGEKIKNSLWGWAPRNRLTQWDHRVALEPNWKPEAARERNDGLKARFFMDNKTSLNYQKGQVVPAASVLWDSDPLDKRRIGEWRRFPVLGKPIALPRTPGPIVRAGVMGEVVIQGGGNVSAENISRLQRRLDRMIVRRRNINVVFVMDGTLSMKPYFPAASEAIGNSMAQLQAGQTQNVFQFAATVYTDYSEGRAKLVESIGLGSGDNVMSFLKGKGYHKLDRDAPEAMYQGLYAALRGTGLDESATNVIVLIGDAGHHRNDPQIDADAIVALLSKYNAHFLAIQVDHKKHPTYEDFITQSRELALKAAQQTYARLSSTRTRLGSNAPPRWETNGRELKLVDGASGGWIIGLQAGQTLEPARLTRNVVDFIRHIDRRNDALMQAIKDVIDGDAVNLNRQIAAAPTGESSQFASPLGPGIIEFLKSSGVTPEQLELMKNKKYQLYVKASAPMKVVNQEEPMFNYVLLLSRGELSDMVRSLRRLLNSVSRGTERRQFFDTWKQELKNYVGEVTEKELESKSMEELSEILFGLPSSGEFLKGVKLRDILDPNRFSDEALAKYRTRMESSWEKLNRIFRADHYEYGFRSNEQPYYWIEQDILP